MFPPRTAYVAHSGAAAPVAPARKKKYKPVSQKVRPVPSYMPNPSAQVFSPVIIEPPAPLPLNPPELSDFVPTERLTRARLSQILKTVPKGFLRDREIDLMVHVLATREKAIAFDDSERGNFSREFFPDYEIPTIEHTPWQQPPIHIPASIFEEVRSLVKTFIDAGKYEATSSSYRSRIFPVRKSDGRIRLVHDLQALNAVTIRDAGMPPVIQDFAEEFVGREIYMIADLFAGFDGRILHENSRDLTSFGTMVGASRLTSLPVGACNSMPEFQRCTTHILREEIPENSNVFVDDAGIKGPRSRYNDEEMPGGQGIRRFVYEFATTADRIFARFERAGITASGKKLVLATPTLNIVGYVVSKEGMHLEHGLVTKILNWPYCTDATTVRGFLGTAGVGRKWIKDFSKIAKPLTRLTRKTTPVTPFAFGLEERYAMDLLKHRVTTAPILRVIDYILAKEIQPGPRETDHGLVVLGVDSSKWGAGWMLFQIIGKDKHPILFGSCTFNDTEANYSQPKLELYGLLRAMKAVAMRIWGIYFRLQVDAKFLEQMIHNPELPNAPMTRWICYINLFDFEMTHAKAATEHLPIDGMSRRPHAPEDSDDEHPSDWLDNFVGGGYVSYSRSATYHYRPGEWYIHADYDADDRDNRLTIAKLAEGTRPNPPLPFADLVTPSTASYVTFPIEDSPPEISERLNARTDEAWRSFDGNKDDAGKKSGSEFDFTLLRSTGRGEFIGNDFMRRSVPKTTTEECLLGGAYETLMITEYRRAYLTEPADPSFPHTDRTSYPEVITPSPEYISCVGHAFGVKDHDSPKFWRDIRAYLKNLKIPNDLVGDAKATRRFIAKCQRFVLHNGSIWLIKTDEVPKLVIEDLERRKDIIASAHNACGHRGRDGVFIKVKDRYYWPNLYDEVAWFVRSCDICQLRSKERPCQPFIPSSSAGVLRRFHLDTMHMPLGHGGKKFVYHAMDPASEWPEARAEKVNNSERWAKFLYEDVICRFGCIPAFVTDGGSEFKGAAKKIMDDYDIPVIMTSPYNPEGNGIVERSHRTFLEGLLRAAGTNERLWPLYTHSMLLACRTTTSRVTGYSPHYMLYAQNPILAFDVLDRTWATLDWDTVHEPKDLLAIRAMQIARHRRVVGEALDRQRDQRAKSLKQFEERHARKLTSGDFDVGAWVLREETWLLSQQGNKGALRYAGPFIINRRFQSGTYELRELDGTIMSDHCAARRLRLFYYREDRQSIVTATPVEWRGNEWLIEPISQEMIDDPTVHVENMRCWPNRPDNAHLTHRRPFARLDRDRAAFSFPISALEPGLATIRGDFSHANTPENDQVIYETNIVDLVAWSAASAPWW